MKKLNFIVISTLIIILSSCLDDSDLEKLRDEEIKTLKAYLQAKGIEYKGTDYIYIVYADSSKRDTSSIKADKNYYALIDYNIRLLSDNKLVETNNHKLAKENSLKPVSVLKGPVIISLKKPPLYGIYYTLLQMTETDSVVAVIPSDYAFGSNSTNLVPSNSSLLFEVRLVKIIKDPAEYDKSFWNRWVVDTLGLSLEDTTEEVPVYMKVIDEGNKSLPVDDYTSVKVGYRGWLADGRAFSNDWDTITYSLGTSDIIKGFDIAVKKLNQGGYAKVFIPYYHAYGSSGKTNYYYQTVIPPYSSLYYEIIIINGN